MKWMSRCHKDSIKLRYHRDGRYLHKVIHRSVVEINMVHQARLLLPVQVNEEDTS